MAPTGFPSASMRTVPRSTASPPPEMRAWIRNDPSPAAWTSHRFKVATNRGWYCAAGAGGTLAGGLHSSVPWHELSAVWRVRSWLRTAPYRRLVTRFSSCHCERVVS